LNYRDPVGALEAFLSSLPSWRRKVLEGEPLSDSELAEYAESSGTRELMFGDEAIRLKYESLLQKIPVRWKEYVRRKKQVVSPFVPRGKPGRPPDHQTLERVLELKSQGKSLRQIAITLGERPEQIPSAIDRYRKLISSALKRSKRGANPA